MIWIGCIVILIIFFIWWGKKPNYYRNKESSDFQRFIEGLIRQGSNGSLLFIKHQKSNRFVQFAKYITEDSEIVINFGFPDANWSKSYFKPLIEALDKAEFDYQVQGTRDASEFVTRFLEVNKKVDDVEKAAEEFSLIAKIAFSVMGIGDREKYRIHFEGELNKERPLDYHLGNDSENSGKGGKACGTCQQLLDTHCKKLL